MTPNPSSQDIVVTRKQNGKSSEKKSTFWVAVLDDAGSEKLRVESTSRFKSVDVSKLPNGVYYLKISENNKTETHRIKVEH